ERSPRAITIDIVDAGDKTPASPRFGSCSILARPAPATAGRIPQSAFASGARINRRLSDPQPDTRPGVARGLAPARSKPNDAHKFVQHSGRLRAQDPPARARVTLPTGRAVYLHHA